MSNAVLPDIKLVAHKPNVFGDEIGFVQKWDFSKANLNEENRILAITQVASICYQSPKALGSESLYNRLASESHGLPSSSFEFVPILLDPWKSESKKLIGKDRTNTRKFGEWINAISPTSGLEQEYLLTNYRAVYYDYEAACAEASVTYANKPDVLKTILDILKEEYLHFFNTEEECKIIADNFYVFLYKIDFPTRSQMVRHRVNWQELSRRYVSGKRVGFDFYISEGMKKVNSTFKPTTELYGSLAATPNPDDVPTYAIGAQDAIDICLQVYYDALEQGVKPQEARRIIPQAAYTQIWGAFQPTQLANYFKLRDDEHAQWEIRQTALAMKNMIEHSKQLKNYSLSEEKLKEINARPKDFLSPEEIEDLLSTALN